MTIEFFKYEGIGNDFIVVDAEELKTALNPTQVQRICDRHRGIGADGVLIVGSQTSTFSMKVLNADGSTGEMCGNGIRCVTKYLLDHKNLNQKSVTIATDSGMHECQVVDDGNQVRVDMGKPGLNPAQVPLRAKAPWIDHEMSVAGFNAKVSAVSMGNPHAVIFEVPEAQRENIARTLAADSAFPISANIGIAHVSGADVLELRVLERGAGWTQACGTGACAAAVAAVETGRFKPSDHIKVKLPGGELMISYSEKGGQVWMTGPVRFVYRGELELSDFS